VHDFAEAGAQSGEGPVGGHDFGGPGHIAARDAPPEDHVPRASQAPRGPRLGQEARHEVAHAVGVAEVLAHELLDREQPRGGLVAEAGGDADLLGAAEHVGRLACLEVQLVAQAEEELARLGHGGQIVGREGAAGAEGVGLGGAVAGRPRPAEQLDLAQVARRSLQVRLEQVHGVAELGPFLAPRLLHGREDRPAAAADLGLELLGEVDEHPGAARQEPRFHERAGDGGVLAGQGAGLLGGAHAVAEHQAGVEHVAEEALGQGGQGRDLCGRAEDHQVHVGIGGHVAAAVAAVGHQGDLPDQARGPVGGNRREGRLEEVQQHLVPQVGDGGADLDPARAGVMAELELLVTLGKPLPGRKDGSTDWRHV